MIASFFFFSNFWFFNSFLLHFMQPVILNIAHVAGLLNVYYGNSLSYGNQDGSLH